MPSITYWSQLQPTATAPSVAESLAARVRDPAWLLARQWQLGEFEGADAGSVAFARIVSRAAPLVSAQLGSATTALGAAQLLEPTVEQEPLTADLRTRVELGQTFEQLLADADVAVQVRDQFRAAYPIAPATAGDDAETARFLRLCAGRAVDGVALYLAAKPVAGQLPPRPAIATTAQQAVLGAVGAFLSWVEATWGAVGDGDPAAWDMGRLQYDFAATAKSPDGGSFTLAAEPDAQAELDWYAFDLSASTPAPPTLSSHGAAPAGAKTASVLPGHVRFRGMPNARWWDFEGSKTDFGAVIPDTRDLAKLLFMDFMLLHGDDWYLAPLEVSAGSLSFIDSLVVRDVFGVEAAVPRADATQNGARWTLFSTVDGAGALAPFLVVPATAAAALSETIEEVHLLRDETADMAWAIEHIVEGPTGAPRQEPPPAPITAPPADVPAPLVYQLATPLPASWFPLLPVATSGGSVALVAGTVEGGPLAPASRIVKRLGAPGFQLADREVPRAGVRLQRTISRTRSADGGMHLWVARRKLIGAGEAASDLRYDLAIDRQS